MEKFISLTKSSDRGTANETERWNTRFIVKYRKWMPKAGEKDEDKSIVIVDHISVPKGTLVVDNSVEDIDEQIK